MADIDKNLTKLACATAPAGFAHAGATLTPEPLLGVGKIQILGAKATAFFEQAFGQAPPPPRGSLLLDGVIVSWLAPGEWLVTGSEADIQAALVRADSVAGDSGLMTDLTHARASFVLSGMLARDTLAGLTPLDISDAALRIGGVARVPFGDTGMFLARLADLDGEPRFRIVVDQTMAAYAVRMLAGPVSAPGANS